jgi:ABC-2 type transport system ATP-binding protein
MSSHAAPAVAEFKDVWKSYHAGLWPRREIVALRGVTLSVPSGSVFGLVGPNRAGKTTLVKLLLSIAHATRGEVQRLHKPVSDRATLARVGYVHDSQAFPGYLSPRGLLAYYGTLSGVDRLRLRESIEERLSDVGLRDRANDCIAGFSKGMLQRLSLAQALVNDPELLVLDEPAEGMDLFARRMLHDVLESRQKDGHTSILVSHSLTDIQRVCDHVAVLKQGQLAFTGRLDEMLQQQSPAAGDLEEALEPLYEDVLP